MRSLAFARSDDGRMLAGVAGGFADQHGVDRVVVRSAIVVLSFAGGLGLVLYAAGAILSSAPGTPMPPRRPRDQRRNLSVAAISLGLLLVVRSTGVWLGDALMVPLVVIVAGFTVLAVWRPDDMRITADSSGVVGRADGRFSALRIVAGTALVAVGLLLVGGNRGVSSGIRIGAVATAMTIVGIGVLVGPWIVRNAQENAESRRQRIRMAEREEMAAHLHDSVLQTLALIQRTAEDPRRTVMLARRQESELREWLYGTPGSDATHLAGLVRAMAAEVESAYDVAVEVVVVGDCAADDRVEALVAAFREACVNAAKHSGAESIAVYVEVEDAAVTAYARDRGTGFDPAVTAPDRRGITLSIVSRMERVGGAAELETELGSGTEVRLSLPLRRASATSDAGNSTAPASEAST